MIVCGCKQADVCRIMINCENNGLEMVVADAQVILYGLYMAVAPFLDYLFLHQ